MSAAMSAAAKAAHAAVAVKRSKDREEKYQTELDDDGMMMERALTAEEIALADEAHAGEAAAIAAGLAEALEDPNLSAKTWRLEPLDDRLFDMFRYDWYVRPPDKIPDLPWGYDVHDFYDPDAIAASAAVNSGHLRSYSCGGHPDRTPHGG
jgi:hypothetical protein